MLPIIFHNLKLKDEDSVGSGGFGDLTHLAAFCKLLDEYFNAVLTISYNVHEQDFKKSLLESVFLMI